MLVADYIRSSKGASDLDWYLALFPTPRGWKASERLGADVAINTLELYAKNNMPSDPINTFLFLKWTPRLISSAYTALVLYTAIDAVVQHFS